MIELKNLSKTYNAGQENQVVALQDISLTVEDGEIFGIIGLSGAGKSTLVRCINLLEQPTSGEVLLDGRDLTKLSRRELLLARRSIGMPEGDFFSALPARAGRGSPGSPGPRASAAPPAPPGAWHLPPNFIIRNNYTTLRPEAQPFRRKKAD